MCQPAMLRAEILLGTPRPPGSSQPNWSPTRICRPTPGSSTCSIFPTAIHANSRLTATSRMGRCRNRGMPAPRLADRSTEACIM